MGILDGIISGYKEAILGPDPNQISAAYKGLQNSINSRYDVDKQKFEADPSNSGKAYELPDPVTRWQHQIDGMITSGNPTLQQEGLRQLSQYHQRATAATTSEAPSSVKEFQYARDNGYQGSYPDWKQLNKSGGNNVTVRVGDNDKPMSISDSMNVVMPDGTHPIGLTPRQAMEAGGTVKTTKDETDRGSSIEALGDAVDDMGDVIDTDVKPIEGVIGTFRNQGGVINDAVNAVLTEAGFKNKHDVVKFVSAQKRITGQVTKLMSSASATESERDYWDSIQPKLSENPDIRKIKHQQQVQFRDMLVNRAKQGGAYKAPKTSNGIDKAISNATSTKPAPREVKLGDKTFKYTIKE